MVCFHEDVVVMCLLPDVMISSGRVMLLELRILTLQLKVEFKSTTMYVEGIEVKVGGDVVIVHRMFHSHSTCVKRNP